MNVYLLLDSKAMAGTERHVATLSHGLSRSDCRVFVVCPRGALLADAVQPHVTALTYRPWSILYTAWLLNKRVRGNAATILHAHNGRSNLLATFVAALAGRHNVVISQHFVHPAHEHRRGLIGKVSSGIHHFIMRRCSTMVCVSNAILSSAVRRYPRTPAGLVHNGIADAEVPDNASKRSERGAAGNTLLTFICVSRLSAEKDVHLLLEAVQRVHAGGNAPMFQLLLVGDGKQAGQLRNLARTLGIDGVVRFLGHRDDVPVLMRSADVFVLPSCQEGFGLVLLEAMSAELPVIAAAAGGPLEMVVDLESAKRTGQEPTGLLFAPGSAESLAAAMVKLMQDQHLRATRGAAGRRRFLECFTADRMAKQTLSVYQQVLDKERQVKVIS